MKTLLLILFIAISTVANAQAPAQINYQGIARNAVGNVLVQKNITIRLSVRDGIGTGPVLYQEVRNLTTSNLGMFNIAIGSPGTVSVTGTLAGVAWESGAKFLQVELDPEGRSNFLDMGAGQLLSVPYALYAGNSAPTGTAGGDLTGSYPNPLIGKGVVTTQKLADDAVSTPKIIDGAVTAVKIAPGVIPTTLPPSGTAGGDLTGDYPNPVIGTGVITEGKLAANAVTNGIISDNAVTTVKINDGAVTIEKIAPGVIPTSLPPGGIAGGELSGAYPNPTIGTGVITSSKLADGSVTASKIAPGVIPTSLPPGGTAGGELSGTYPNPTIGAGVITTSKLAANAVTTAILGDNVVTTAKILDASVTAAKLAPGVIPTFLPPGGTAGGELTGTYPNPTIGTGVITSSKLADNAVTTAKILDASVTAAKLAPGVIPTSLPPGGTAGGELSGTYPNPTIGAGVITTSKLAANAVTTTVIADNAVTTSKILDASVTAAKLAPGVIPTSIPPGGTAGGELSGTYPNPTIGAGVITTSKLAANAVTTTVIADNAVTTSKILDASVTAAKLAPGVIPTSIPPGGTAGGELSGTYPNPTIGAGVITTSKLAANAVTTTVLADNAVTTSKILDASVTAAKLAPGVIPTSLPPGGTAGGELSGTYPNPTIGTGVITTSKLAANAVTTTKLADNAVITSKILDASVTAAKLAPGVIPTSLPPGGTAGGELSGTYPNPTIGTGVITTSKLAANAVTATILADNAVTTSKILNASVTAAKLAAGVIPTSLPPNGTAGGELAGTYPNPTIGTGVITTAKLADNAVSTSKVQDASITLAKLGPDVILGIGGGAPSGSAGGDLSGIYPDPKLASGSVTVSKIANGAVNTPKLADGAVSTNKLADDAVTTAKVLDGAITLAKLDPALVLGIGGALSGPAGGDLSGNYPNPAVATGAISTIKIADNAITTSKVSDGSITLAKLDPALVLGISGALTGPAGGDLSGNYPNPAVASGAISTIKIADNAITTAKMLDASVTAAKIAPGVIPTALPPSGTAGGDLGGTYPNPTISKLQGVAFSTTAPASGQVLKYNGTQWAPGTDNASGVLALPYSASATNAANLFALTNGGAGAAIEGNNSSTNNTTVGVLGRISSVSGGTNSSGLRGIHNGTGANGMGVWGSHNGSGAGVYGFSTAGNGIQGNSTNGIGVFGTSVNNSAGYFDMANFSGTADAITAYNVGMGNGVTAVSENGNGLWAITYSPTSAAILGYNIGGGEVIVGRNSSSSAAAIVGRNDGTFAGVQGVGGADGAVGVLAVANIDGFVNGNALVAAIEGASAGNPAVFMADGSNVARIDNTGKGFFNGGTQVGGADVAEYFDVDGNRNTYEPGDVLIISSSHDRSVQKSSGAYSSLVAGVYATKPGLLLTEKNAEQDHLDMMVPMGVIGVIPTKVCLEGGAIKRGDLIVTSSQPGVAMKADPDKVKPGQLIGKALQEYNGSGVAKINVLVSMK